MSLVAFISLSSNFYKIWLSLKVTSALALLFRILPPVLLIFSIVFVKTVIASSSWGFNDFNLDFIELSKTEAYPLGLTAICLVIACDRVLTLEKALVLIVFV